MAPLLAVLAGAALAISTVHGATFANLTEPVCHGQPAISAFTYEGCFTDSADRTLVGKLTIDDGLTLEKCGVICSGYKYFGVEVGRECYCGNSITSKSIPTRNPECSAKCGGDASQKCGSDWRISIYSKPEISSAGATPLSPPTNGVVNYSAVGAYSTTGDKVLDGPSTTSDKMTIEACSAACSGYKYCGVQGGTTCSCGNNLSTGSSRVPSTEAKTPCPGNSAQQCGGPSACTVYTIVSTSTTIVVGQNRNNQNGNGQNQNGNHGNGQGNGNGNGNGQGGGNNGNHGNGNGQGGSNNGNHGNGNGQGGSNNGNHGNGNGNGNHGNGNGQGGGHNGNGGHGNGNGGGNNPPKPSTTGPHYIL
ncbi:WSC domain-containing protein [Amylocarpus encephaloides]|uniref:WSC domain-containing protein n=1 Tax=Amylocarpus encephaloides TaxID=45428 RepID=A0A9P7YE03_9HELO|nr:WSC domain-containing protein [Amylocarpus encephaloides]